MCKQVVLKMSHKKLNGFAGTSSLAQRFNTTMLPFVG